MKLDADEKALLESVERGEWKSTKSGKRERARYSRYAKATFRKDRRLNIRLSSKDLEAIQKRALAELSDHIYLPHSGSRAESVGSDVRDGLILNAIVHLALLHSLRPE